MRRAAMLSLVALLIFAILRNRTPEPAYRGRPLSLWVEQQYRQVQTYGPDHPDAQADEAREAIKAIGSNGVPFLVRWLRYEEFMSGTRFLSWAPKGLGQAIDRAFFSQRRADLAEGSMQALVILGTNAAPAIPELARLMWDTKHPVEPRIALTLNQLGPEALPAMLYAWSNATPAQKPFLSAVIGSGLPQNIRSREQLPLLLPILQTHDEPLRSQAYEALSHIAPDLLTNSPK